MSPAGPKITGPMPPAGNLPVWESFLTVPLSFTAQISSLDMARVRSPTDDTVAADTIAGSLNAESLWGHKIGPEIGNGLQVRPSADFHS